MFKFQVPVKAFWRKEWNFTSFGAYALPNCWNLTNYRGGTFAGFIDLDWRLLLYQPPARVHGARWSGSGCV